VHRVRTLGVVAELTRELRSQSTPSTTDDAQPGTHAVDPAVSGAHSHEHAHSVRSLSSKRAAHDHAHRHEDDPQADNELNGHTHARPHTRLPWESRPEPTS
jgi:hypothetical protein